MHYKVNQSGKYLRNFCNINGRAIQILDIADVTWATKAKKQIYEIKCVKDSAIRRYILIVRKKNMKIATKVNTATTKKIVIIL